MEPQFTPAKNVLLTGAGFTKNFGGYLSSEMWAVILNQPEIRQSPKGLRPFLLEQMDYEIAYDEVLKPGRFGDEDQNAFVAAIRNSYKQMHKDIYYQGINLSAYRTCHSLFERFRKSSAAGEKGFYFSLNQDLFVETFYKNEFVLTPGLTHSKWFNGKMQDRLEEEEWCRLPSEEKLAKRQQNWAESSKDYCYVKLHGSYGWKTQDGSDLMVIGTTKTSIIENEPLLRWYLALFREVLNYGQRNLVVVGYSFMDEHINEAIVTAIESHKLRLHIVSPKQPREFKKLLCEGNSVLKSAPLGRRLWEGLFGYHTNLVTDFCKRKGQLTSQGQTFFDSLEK